VTTAWRSVPLGSLLKKSEEVIWPVADVRYTEVTVRLWGRGVVARGDVDGLQLVGQRRFRARPGQFIASRIDARNGALGVVPTSLDGAIVTNDFPLFDVDPERLEPAFLNWLSRTERFVELCRRASEGTTNRVRLKEERFLALEIALPAVEEQRRIVARIEAIAGKIDEARRLRGETEAGAAALASSAASAVFSRLNNCVPLGDVCEVIDPNPSHRYPMYVPDGVPIVSSSEFVGEDAIDGSRAKRVPRSFFDETLGRFDIRAGDVVFSRKGKVGYARPYPADQVLAMTHTLCVLKPNRAKLNPQFLLHFSRSSSFIDALLTTMNPNVGVPTLGLGVIRSVATPLPSLEVQQRIADELESMRILCSTARSAYVGSRLSLDALLPAILDRAFKGEL
jgi:type I restriction enzyme S subunit